MITKEITYKIAFEKKSAALKEKQRKRDMLLSSAYASNKILYEIDQELSEAGASLVITALSGDKAKIEDLRKRTEALNAQKNEILKNCAVEDIVYDCAVCKDTGYVSGKICECIKKEAAFVLAKELSKEMPLENSRFDNFDLKYYSDKKDENGISPKKRMTSILKFCKEYVSSFNPETSKNILFMGNPGLGKTHLTLAIVSGVIEKGYLPIYASAENLFSSITAEKFSGEGRGTYESALNSDLLVIDDLGTEMATEFTKSAFYNIVNTRILNGKPTIINTNLSMKEIEIKYSARISSRLIGNYEGNKFLGNDIRQQKLLNK